MMNKRIRALLLLVILVLGRTSLWAAAPPLRIMPLGDSLTIGCCINAEGGFRTRLYLLLAAAGYNVDFVGTQITTSNNSSLFDPDHEGHGGANIGFLDSGVEGWFSAVDDPDVILLLIGTNDFAGNNDVGNARNRLENLIAHLAALRPHATIIVGNVPLRTDLSWANDQIQTLYNPYIPGIVAHQAALGRHVLFADLRSVISVGDLADGLHPNLNGYNKIADVWFSAITAAMGPNGAPQRPAIVRTAGQVDLKHVVVTFSKPLEDAAANPNNFRLSGSLSPLTVELDARTKRTITITTSQQALSSFYTVIVDGVRDRTADHNSILPGSIGSFESGRVAEAANYRLVYSLKVPNQADFNSTGIPYEVDTHTALGSFTRIAYYLELQARGGPVQYVWASMDGFTTDGSKIGIPSIQSDAFFQRSVANLTVRSSILPAVDGAQGHLEFWPGDYSSENEANVSGAGGALFDAGDSAAPGAAGYGSMQLHNPAAGQTVFAFNGWGGAGLINDLGVGNCPGVHPDWTFAQNAAGYTSKLLQVYALPGSRTPNVPVITAQPSDFTTSPGGTVSFTVAASDTESLSYQWRLNGIAISGASSPTYTIQNVQPLHAGSYDVVVSNSSKSATSWPAVLTVLDGQLLSNGGFESGLSGWMTAGNLTLGSSGFYQSSEGTKLMVFNSGNTIPNGILLHGVSTTVGQTYLLGFDVGVIAFNQSEQRLLVTVQGARTLSSRTTPVFGVGNGTIKWFPQSLSFTADSSTTTLMFQDVSPTTGALDLLLDNVRLTRQGPILRTLTVTSANPNSGASIRMAPIDSAGRGTGATGLSRSYLNGTAVVLTAATMAAGNTFWKWQKDGVDLSQSTRTTIVLDADYHMSALYVPTRTLTVNSLNPGSGVMIRVGPVDNNGAGNGIAEFTRLYGNGTLVTLDAPAVAAGNSFKKWQRDGIDYSNSSRISVTLRLDSTFTAVY